MALAFCCGRVAVARRLWPSACMCRWIPMKAGTPITPLAAMAGHALYPPRPDGQQLSAACLFILSARWATASVITSWPGGWFRCLSFLAVAHGASPACCARWAARVLDGIFAGLFFAAALLIASDYVAMNDPQLLGHALQIAGLAAAVAGTVRPMAGGAAVDGWPFRQANLLVLPLAALLWLAWQDRATGDALRPVWPGLRDGRAIGRAGCCWVSICSREIASAPSLELWPIVKPRRASICPGRRCLSC